MPSAVHWSSNIKLVQEVSCRCDYTLVVSKSFYIVRTSLPLNVPESYKTVFLLVLARSSSRTRNERKIKAISRVTIVTPEIERHKTQTYQYRSCLESLSSSFVNGNSIEYVVILKVLRLNFYWIGGNKKSRRALQTLGEILSRSIATFQAIHFKMNYVSYFFLYLSKSACNPNKNKYR